MLDGVDVADRLSDPSVTEWVSEVSQIPAVRTTCWNCSGPAPRRRRSHGRQRYRFGCVAER